MLQQDSLKYPIGKLEDQPYTGKEAFDEKIKAALLRDIQACPGLLENAVLNLDEHQLNTPYRPGGWTVHELVHHVADSHMNAYMRFKLGLTEDNPTIKTYEEAAWAELSDTKNLPINISLTLLHALHTRLLELMKGMTEADWQRTIYHPVHNRNVTLWNLLAMYSWHGKHHVAHIMGLRERMKW